MAKEVKLRKRKNREGYTSDTNLRHSGSKPKKAPGPGGSQESTRNEYHEGQKGYHDPREKP